MNVLLFVFALLMILGMTSYAKMQTFLVGTGLQGQYLEHMQQKRQNLVADQQYLLYQNYTGIESDKPDEEEQEPKTQVKAVSKINVALFLNKQLSEQHGADAENAKILFLRLVEILYGKQEFYKEMLHKRPHFMEQLIAELIDKCADLPKNLQNVKQLANLKLSDEQLQEVLAKMLLGNMPAEKKQLKADQYPPLGEFISCSKAKKPFRLQLLPPELLLALYEDENIVKDIMKKRDSYFNQVKNKYKTEFNNLSSKLQDEFKYEFETKAPLGFENMINYEISKSTPKNKWSYNP